MSQCVDDSPSELNYGVHCSSDVLLEALCPLIDAAAQTEWLNVELGRALDELLKSLR